MPATSPGLESITSHLKPCAAHQRRYMRSSICAQSCASVPPAPAWMSRKALCTSISPWNMRLSSRCRTSDSRRCASFSMSRAAGSSPSASASSSSSTASEIPLVVRSMWPTSWLSRARSRPSSCARAGLDHTAGSSSSRPTSSRRSCLRSYSKKPPERVDAFTEVLELAAELIDFHNLPADGAMRAGGARLCDEAEDASTRRGVLASGGQQVIDQQLQPPLPLVLIHLEAIDELPVALGQRRVAAVFEMVERDGIERASAAWHLHPHLHVPLADHTRAPDGEQ